MLRRVLCAAWVRECCVHPCVRVSVACCMHACMHGVGDITAGHKPTYLVQVNFISSSRVIKPKKADEGLRPVAGSRLVAINRDLYINLYCKLGIRRDQPGYEYRPVLGLCELTGVTRVYKGTTRRRFKERQQLET